MKTSAKKNTIQWIAYEHPPRKRWWWYIVFLYAAFIIGLIAIGLGRWLLSLLTIIVAVAVLAVYRSGSRRVEAVLDRKTITVNGQSFELTAYQAFYIVPNTRDVVLVPKRSISLPVTIPLPRDEGVTVRIIERLEEALPQRDYHKTWFDAIVNWARLG